MPGRIERRWLGITFESDEEYIRVLYTYLYFSFSIDCIYVLISKSRVHIDTRIPRFGVHARQYETRWRAVKLSYA